MFTIELFQKEVTVEQQPYPTYANINKQVLNKIEYGSVDELINIMYLLLSQVDKVDMVIIRKNEPAEKPTQSNPQT